jgi:ParB-like nuclease family protein
MNRLRFLTMTNRFRSEKGAVMDYEIHDAATIFPLVEGEDLDALANDIQAHGLIEPILLYEGMILDGRNRLRACEMVGVAPRFQEAQLNGLSPLEFVISKNLHRRHLTAGQRAALALTLLPRLREEASQRKGIGRPPDDHYEETIRERREALGEPGRATLQAGAIVGVGASSVENVEAIRARDPEVFEKVRSGELNIRQGLAAVGMGTGQHKTKFAEAEAMSSGETDSTGRRIPSIYYGKGDRWIEATTPILRYLRGWERRSFEFRHVNSKEAQKRLKLIHDLQELLSAAQEDLERRAHVASLTVKG